MKLGLCMKELENLENCSTLFKYSPNVVIVPKKFDFLLKYYKNLNTSISLYIYVDIRASL